MSLRDVARDTLYVISQSAFSGDAMKIGEAIFFFPLDAIGIHLIRQVVLAKFAQRRSEYLVAVLAETC